MTTRMIRIDDAYADKLEAFVAANSEFMQIVVDENLEYDEYYYERKVHLQKTIESIDTQEMKLFSEKEAIDKMDTIEKELILQYAD
jgi:hypothetical protein